MLKPVTQPSNLAGSHEGLFIARYHRLMVSAVRLAEGQRAAAEDLVQDAFIQFTLKRPDLNTIESLDDYLYVMMRNLHISQARRASQSQTTQLVISDYDTAQMGLRLLDPERRLQARDDLRRVCEYVTQRKETSKAGSVLILRFFHNYFPAEISALMLTTRTAVEVWLLNARRESRLFLENPAALKIISKEKSIAKKVAQFPSRVSSRKHTDIFAELREMIFASRQGECLSDDQLRDLYREHHREAVKSQTLAHLVSCPQCLDAVNDLLGLPSLAERYFGAARDAGTPPPDAGGPSDTTGSGASGTGETGKRLRRRRRETIEHRPQELRIAVNGFFVGGQKIGLPVNELTLKLNLEEKISFVEAFSEQGLLLSHFRVTPPTDGEVEQREEVEFGEGRALELGVNFDTQWPTLHIVYRDPLVAQLQSEAVEEVPSPMSNVQSRQSIAVARQHEDPMVGDRGIGLLARAHKRWRDFTPWTLDFGLFLRPATVTAIVALLFMATLLIVRRPGPTAPLTAADVLQRAAQAEQIAAASTQTVIHRTLQIEERRVAQTSGCEGCDGDLIARRRVEVWQSTARGVTARRLYDDRGRLLAGEWIRNDNVTTFYHHGARPQLQIRNPQSAIRNFEDVWQLSPWAKDFTALLGNEGLSVAKVEDRDLAYVVTFEGPGVAQPGMGRNVIAPGSRPELSTPGGAEPQHGGMSPSLSGAPTLVSATLSLRRDDLHATNLLLVIQQDSEVRSYRISETSFERRPNDAVAPAVFEPDVELLSDTETRRHGDTENLPASPSLPVPASAALATPALEVEVLQLLNQVNAFMGEQLSVSRTSDGRLLVSGLVDTLERKAELFRALAPVRGNPAVRVQLETFAEAARRERPKSSGSLSVERIETTEGTSAAYADLKQRFSDDEARRFADRVMSRSRQARRHALALKQLAERFSLTDLQTLSGGDRGRWLGLLQQHARDFERQAAALRRDLQQVFPVVSVPAAESSGFSSDAQIQESVRRLYELSVTFDEQVRQSFALSAERPSVAPVKTQQFWRTLSSAEALASRLAR